jgi:hypothetical protein
MKTVKSGKTGLLSLAVCLFLVSVSTAAPAESGIAQNEQERQIVQSNEVVVRELDPRGKTGRTFEAVGIINARRSIIQNILVDYEKYPEFMPNVSRIAIVQQDDSTTVLNYILSLPLGKIKKYRISMKESEPDGQTSFIQWRLQEWPGLKPEETIKDTDGFWRIEDLEQGRSLVLYHVYTDPGPVPFGLGWIIDILSKDSVPDVLLRTKNRAEKEAGFHFGKKD